MDDHFLDDVGQLLKDDSAGAEVRLRFPKRMGTFFMSGVVHATMFAILLIVNLVSYHPPAVTQENHPDEVIPLNFVQPRLPAMPAPIQPKSPLAGTIAPPPPSSTRAEPPAPSLQAPQIITPPKGPLPTPNRMGDTPPIPAPPKPSKDNPPPEAGDKGSKGERSDRPLPPAQQGSPDAEDLQGSIEKPEDANPQAGEIGGGSPADVTAEGSHGSLTFPQKPKGSGPDATRPGVGGGGIDPGAGGKQPQRKGLDYGVPYDTGMYQNFSFEDSDFDWTDYWSVMYWAIWKTWHNKLYLGLSVFEREAFEKGTPGLEGTVTLRFTIERNGNVSKVEVITPSGVNELDHASIASLREVLLPPLPGNFKKDRERVTARFIMDVEDVREWRSGMTFAKSQGVF